MTHHLLYWILQSLFMHNMLGSDHRKDSLQANQPSPILFMGRRLEQRHIWL
ncbi:hypothetical protein Pint_33164 [Pistacia integerrima]|uniref:Uncharacterized protein n=1 Tax=Pistacia integerrima TaxID=434235 RepID=A0ACC0X5H5_9ROSI|nr:hypothetical protein Pint_33164 [Pistacia integerrima]